jgi:putative transcriptional regulator
MLNHEIDPSLGETFLREHFSISPTLYLKNRPVFLGGPQGPEFGYVLHTGQDKQYTSSACLQEGLYLTISKDIIAAMARNKGPEKSLFLMGSCQWEPKVLESEIAKHYWMVIPGTPDFIFSIPTEKRWRRAMELAGIDNPYQLTQCVGHG